MPSSVVDVFRDLAAALESLGARWYLFGAQAAIIYGSARLSADVDVTVDGAVPPRDLADALGTRGFRLRVTDLDGFVEKTRVLPFVHVISGLPVDVVLAGPGIEDLFFARARTQSIGGVRLSLASPEDLIVMKILAGRPKDSEDILAILAAQSDTLDLELVRETLTLLEGALDQSDLSPAFAELLTQARSKP